MYNDELIKLCKSKSGNVLAKNKEYKEQIIKATPFLTNSTISNRIGYIINNITKLKFCEICNIHIVTYNTKQHKFNTCSRKCGGKRSNATLRTIIDQSTGLSKLKSSIKKRKQTMKMIDPSTGLSVLQSSDIKRQKTMSMIDQSTGLSKSKMVGKKISKSLNKINKLTGLSPSQEKEDRRHKTMSMIDQSTSLSKYAIARHKQHKTMSIIDESTGLSKSILAKHKQHETMSSTIDQLTGLSVLQLSKIKRHKTMSIIDESTGLSKRELSEITRQKTMKTINESTGLSPIQEVSILIQKAMSQIDEESGLTLRKLTNSKIKTTIKSNSYNSKLNNFPKDYTLISNTEDYISSSLLQYSHICGNISESYWPYIRCTTCYPYIVSSKEFEVFEYCQSLSNNIESNTRQVISPLELDVYISDDNLAIEYNGLYWHSSEFKNEEYHLNKTNLCKEKSIQLLHIFENEWIDPIKQNIWKSIIRNKLGKSNTIYGRKTEIREVNNKDKIEFLNINHLQGNCSSSINIGLYHQDELVSLMTFGKSRYDKLMDWELLRYCNAIGSSVLGGAGKLLKYFMMNHKGSIISYADRRHSDGGLYEKLGFELSHISKPNYWYWKNNGLESRIKYQKHKLKDKLKIFDLNLTESENMHNNGYRKIFDCGSFVYKL